MLPPISAVSAADTSLLSLNLKQDVSPPSVAEAALPVETDAPLNSASAMARAVSGEVHLSQTLPVLAETLGKLMNIARMENETAEAYVNRLITTIQTLPAVQKAGLEKELGALLKGLNLAMLSDALKNSSGPEAARLAVIFELFRSSQANGGPKADRSSYLQDAIPFTSAAVPMKPIALTIPTVPDEDANAARLQGINLITGKGTPVYTSPDDKQSLDVKVVQPVKLSTSEASEAIAPHQREAPETASLKDRPANTFTRTTVSEARPAKSITTDLGHSNPMNVTAATEKPTRVQSPAGNLQNNIDSDETRASNILAAASFQNLQLNPLAIKEQFSNTSAKEMEVLLRAVLLGKLPALGDTEYQSSSLLPPPVQNAQAQPAPKTSAPPALPHQSNETENGEIAAQSRTEIQVNHRASVAADLKSALLDQPALQSAVAAMITKEGTPLPFVNYPTEKDEPESDTPPRGRWPSSSGEEQSPEEQSGEQHQEQPEQEERVAANDEAADKSISDGASEDGRVGDAESYYLRMSNFA